MKFGSVCSGIEAASVAWRALGWTAAWFSEIEAFPRAALAHHYPGIENHGDMRGLPDKIRMGMASSPEVLCGGTPCQAFSVAGNRESLEDERGNLTLTFCEIGDAIDDIRLARGEQPCIFFWENVPGVLNTDDNAFGCFLGKIAGEDEALVSPFGKWPDAGFVVGPRRAIAWRILDAQYFGLAQRRERVFLVASAREGFDPAAILFEFDGVRRDFAPSREPRQNTAADARCGTEAAIPILEAAGRTGKSSTDARAGVGIGEEGDPMFTLQSRHQHAVGTLRSTDGGVDVDHAMADHLVVSTLDASYGRLQGCAGQDMNHGHNHLVPVAFGQNRTRGPVDVGQIRAHGSSHNDFESETFVVQPVGFVQNQREEVRTLDIAGALPAEPGMKQQTYVLHGTQDPLVNTELAFPLGRNSGQENAIAFPLDLRNALRDPDKRDEQNRQGVGVGEDGDPAGTLTKAHVPGVAAAAFKPAHYTRGKGGGALAESVPALTAEGDRGDTDSIVVTEAYGFQQRIARNGRGDMGDVAGALNAQSGATGKGDAAPCVAVDMQVRRLMPVECERLQGFPDGYTAIPTWTGWRKMDETETPESCQEAGLEIRKIQKTGKWRVRDVDGPRYKALGNSWAVPCVTWIGERIQIMVEVLDAQA